MEHHDDQDWGTAPSHLLSIILEKLESTKDFLHFGVVGETWNSVLKFDQSKRLNTPLHNKVPLLMIPNEDEHTWNLYDITNNKFLESKLSVPYGKRLCGSSQGWLGYVNSDYSLTLYKPFSKSRNKIELPCVFPPDSEVRYDPVPYYFHVGRFFITTDPLTNPDECVIVITFGYADDMAFFRLTKDITWTKFNRPGSKTDDIMHHGGKLYNIRLSGEIFSFDYMNLSPPKLVEPSDYTIVELYKKYIVRSSCGRKTYLIRRYLNFNNKEGELEEWTRFTSKFNVYELSLDGRNQRKEIKSIGDNAIFIGDSSTICVKASNFNGCQRNSIYFTHDLDILQGHRVNVICDLGIYHIQTKEFKLHFTMDSSALRTISRPPIWIVPTFNVN